MREFLIQATRLFIFTSVSYTLICVGDVVQSVTPELVDAYHALLIGVGITAGYKLLEG